VQQVRHLHGPELISVIVPCRNEEGNVPFLIQSLSNLTTASEVIFVEGGSSDNTFEELRLAIIKQHNANLKVIRQTGSGKFNAVLEGSSQATSDYIAIWDGDNTIDSVDQNFLMLDYCKLNPSTSFVTANRFNSRRDKNAFRTFNMIGNKVFSALVRVVLHQNLPDVLAGTKIFPKYILDKEFGCLGALRLDPFGDLYLIAMASKANLEFRSVDCRYQTRSYGKTNIKRWSGGWALLKCIIHFQIHGCVSSDKRG
jgi:glycosyltransferase involved in cell wall biosynthesis